MGVLVCGAAGLAGSSTGVSSWAPRATRSAAGPSSAPHYRRAGQSRHLPDGRAMRPGSSSGVLRFAFSAARRRATAGANWKDDAPLGSRAEQREEKQQRKQDNSVIAAGALGLTALALVAATVGEDYVEDMLYGTGMGLFGAGDAFGALLWAFSLWFCSPWQTLLLFLGFVETERPSDWLILNYGKLTGQRVDSVEYSAPTSLRVAAAATCLLAGVAIAASLELGLGDATWSVSTGVGSVLIAGIYEVGRPNRLNAEEAEELQAQWSDFVSFADERLLRTGRCHETEIYSAFRKSYAKYRDPAAIPDRTLRDMVRQWFPASQRTSTGYYKNVSVVPRADPFQ